MDSKSDTSGIEIAVIGISCRFPNANNPKEFWRNLREGKESIVFMTDVEMKRLKHEVKDADNFVGTKGAILKEKECFDYPFFGYSYKEASVMDPQMRIMHESVWEALEDACYDPFDYNGKIGLIAGLSANYSWIDNSQRNDFAKDIGFYHSSTLAEKDFSVLNIAHRLNLKGPCYNIFTSCSTSLVAVHQACRALITGECNIMIAGGVSLSTEGQNGYHYQEGMILSADGHCRAFDKDATGTVKGEGAGFVVLKKLRHAISDRDNIYAVIKGSAVNNDGKKAGFFAPSVQGQKEVIKSAMKIAKVESRTITYVEAHGTATYIGDPVEIASLNEAFATDQKQFCAIGSVKTNIGHLDVAAGIAGFIKTILCIKNKTLVPSLNFTEPNPHMNLSSTPFFVIDKIKEWKGVDGLLRAGVSSFGIGGTNAHIILENFEHTDKIEINRPNLFIFSAKRKHPLDSIVSIVKSLVNREKLNLSDIEYALQGRNKFQKRCFSIVENDNGSIVWNDYNQSPVSRNKTLLFLFDDELPNLNLLIELFQYNKNLQLLYGSLDKIFQDKFKCSIEKFCKTNQSQISRRLVGFIYQFVITEFFRKMGILPAEIYVKNLGLITMCCLNDIISVGQALDIIIDREISFQADILGRLKINIESNGLRNPFYTFSGTDFNSIESVIERRDGNPANDRAHLLLFVGTKFKDSSLDGKYNTIFLCSSNSYDLYKNILRFLGIAWVSGFEVDLNYYNRYTDSVKTSIPTYPFQKKKIESPSISQHQYNNINTENWFFNLMWEQKDFNDNVYVENRALQSSYFLSTRTEFEIDIIKDLSANRTFLDFDIANIEDSSFYDTLRINKSNKIRLCCFLGFENDKRDCIYGTDVTEIISKFLTCINLIRELARQSDKKIEINFITHKSFNITKVEDTDVSLSLINAIVKILPLEIHNISCRLIDLNVQHFDIRSLELLDKIMNIPFNTPVNENIYAIRNNICCTRTLQPYVFYKEDATFNYIAPGDLILITGGIGGIGYIIAKSLLEYSDSQLILIGRKSLEDIKIDKKSEYEYLMKFSSRVHYYSIDISDTIKMEQLKSVILKQHGVISGIYHTAGVVDFGGVLERRSNDSIVEALKVKVHGTINLNNMFNTASLNFFVLFSSIGNILYEDKIGQIAYNAGNEFLDSFANISDNVISVNWCDWKERGMTVDSVNLNYGNKKGKKILSDMKALGSDEGIQILNKIVNKKKSNIIVSKIDLSLEVANGNDNKHEALLNSKSFFSTGEIRKALRNFFMESFSTLIENDELDFFDLGADSLTVINSLPKINHLFDCSITISDFYAQASINKLSNFIYENKRSKFIEKTEQIAVKLGTGRKILFAFPPAIGLGFLAYRQLESLLPDHTIYAINFLKDPDRLEKYVSFINEIAKNEKCVFLGYSAGGTLAYEVARKVRKTKISDLIVLDTYIYRDRLTKDQEARKLLKSFFDEAKLEYGEEEVFKTIAPLMARYYFYINNLISEGAISANIHLIKAEDHDRIERKNRQFVQMNGTFSKYREWPDLTQNNYRDYKGYGRHNDMLNDEFLIDNIDLISKILNC